MWGITKNTPVCSPSKPIVEKIPKKPIKTIPK